MTPQLVWSPRSESGVSALVRGRGVRTAPPHASDLGKPSYRRQHRTHVPRNDLVARSSRSPTPVPLPTAAEELRGRPHFICGPSSPSPDIDGQAVFNHGHESTTRLRAAYGFLRRFVANVAGMRCKAPLKLGQAAQALGPLSERRNRRRSLPPPQISDCGTRSSPTVAFRSRTKVAGAVRPPRAALRAASSALALPDTPRNNPSP